MVSKTMYFLITIRLHIEDVIFPLLPKKHVTRVSCQKNFNDYCKIPRIEAKRIYIESNQKIPKFRLGKSSINLLRVSFSGQVGTYTLPSDVAMLQRTKFDEEIIGFLRGGGDSPNLP